MLPETLLALQELATNLWWTEQADAHALWAQIDPVRWERSRHNPVALLHDVERGRWQALGTDVAFVTRANALLARMRSELTANTWCEAEAPGLRGRCVAYLSMEFGLHQSLRIYSGGLGVLAGDHLRSASDLGVPLAAVGLLYREGYFRQLFDDGQQTEAYPRARFDRLPVRPCVDAAGAPIRIRLPIGADIVVANVWRLAVGRIGLYLLDTDLDGNPDGVRALTRHLYGGDEVMRIRQEILLGIGGVLALRAVGLKPDVIHLNEGHCAFAPLVLVADGLAAGQDLDVAEENARRRFVFTTHTPVPAGHDRFPAPLVLAELGPWCASVGIDAQEVVGLGRVKPDDAAETVCMTVVALRLARSTNGVAALHGEVSRDM
jgi:starch phosphorylase